MKRLLAFVLIASLYTACDEPDFKPNEVKPTPVNYKELNAQISETSAAYEVVILLAEAAEANGVVEIEISNPEAYADYFTTEPAASGAKISLVVETGDTEISFTVLPINNTKLNGHRATAFSITRATGSVKLGENIEYTLTFADDELTNKLMMYEKNGAVMNTNKYSYDYNEDGLVSKIYWQAKTPLGTSNGIHEYFYNEAGGITRILKSTGPLETKYIWKDGVVEKSENVQNGELTSYNVYEYDDAKRVNKINFFTKNPAGEFHTILNEVYAYHEDGNIHKIIINSFNSTANDFVMSVETTYETYVEGHNPHPLEVLPGKNIQTKLPTYYSRKTPTVFHEYHAAYEFSNAGNLTKKTITGEVADSGVTTYSYY